MTNPLRCLVCEDSEDDFELLRMELRRAGYAVEATRVQSGQDFAAALNERNWDIVISDWSMPGFNAPEALAILRSTGLDIPFIILSGTVGEEAAVEAMRNGAHDFLLKNRLARLGVVVERELREANTRRERAKMQEQLMISDRMASVGVLAAGVAHEINNPLAAVMANLDLALSDLEAPTLDLSAVREELADARAAAERVRDIVRDLRIFSRTAEEPRGPISIEKVMESTLRMASNEIRHRARVVRNYKPVPPIQAPEARLGQVFLNLVVNAAQAIAEGRADKNEIRVTIDSVGDRARIIIADTGHGIPPEAMKRLFTPFYTTKPANIGTGLGLSICHRIVTSLGGEIHVESTPGAGTAFTVLLPFGGPGTQEAETRPLQMVDASRRGRVLVIDDEPMIARAVHRVVSAEHDIESVTRGVDALEKIRGGDRYDVIICDLMMPEMTGMDIYEELMSFAPDQAKAMVFLTGGAFTSRAQAFLARTENLQIEKPFEPAFLRAVINDRIR